jgi:XTP/dITP diphosphohydrolase
MVDLQVRLMFHHRKLLIATHNRGKLREYRQLLADLPIAVVDLSDVGITEEVPETGASFAENAVQKAVAYAELSGLWTWADDSGLEVDALGGEPGVYSARYGGPAASDVDRYHLLLQRMADVPPGQRSARFRCAVAIAIPGGQVQVAEGSCEGEIAYRPHGEHGFGYDPIFHLPARGLTMAELSSADKNQISHRAHAARAALLILERLLMAET